MNHAQPAQRGATGWSGKRWVPGRCLRHNYRSLWVRPRRDPAAAAYASAFSGARRRPVWAGVRQHQPTFITQ